MRGEWVTGTGKAVDLFHAVTGNKIAEATTAGIDFKGMVDYAKSVGGPALRRMTFHERALMLKAMAHYLMARKDEFYLVSAATGATKQDSWVDIEGGIGTFFAYASRGRREFPNETFYVDGPVEALSKGGTFVGRHICVPMEGVAVHINAFNFPVWGMLEKLAPTLLAGVPAIVKPATLTSYLTESVFRAMIESGLLPAGAVQLLCGSTGDLLEHLDGQSPRLRFTGSASTGKMLKPGDRRRFSTTTRALQHGSGLAELLPMLGPGRCSARDAGVRSVHQGSRARDDDEGGDRSAPRICIARSCRRTCCRT